MFLKQCKSVYVCNDGSIYFLTKPLLKGAVVKTNICEFSFNNLAVWKKKRNKIQDSAVELFNFRNKFNNY